MMSDICIRCARELALEKVKKDSLIIKYNEEGTKYYIVISGKIRWGLE